MEINPTLKNIPDFPFDRLRSLLSNIDVPAKINPISLAVGEPQQAVPEKFIKSIFDYSHTWNKYPTANGSPELRTAIVKWINRRFRIQNLGHLKNVLACAGSKEAIYLLTNYLTPKVKSGRVPIIAMPNPYYHVYQTSAISSGADQLYLPATAKSGFLPNLNNLDKKVLDRLAVLFICSPANPQGVIASKGYFEQAIRLARKHDFVIISDECYSDIYYSTQPVSALQTCNDMASNTTSRSVYNRVIVTNSLSKRSNAAGFRSGFIAGDEEIIEGFARFRSCISATIPQPIEVASAKLWSDDGHVDKIRQFYRRNVETAATLLNGKFDFYKPEGGFFLWLQVEDGEKAAQILWQKGGLKVLPGSYIAHTDVNGFNPGKKYIRVALVAHNKIIKSACRRLVNIL